MGDDGAATKAGWTAPASCDQCPHPISEHTLWEPDAKCAGWMHCRAEDCDTCWHDWPILD